MRILLDECVDRRLARDLVGHEVKTVPQMGWATIKNGELLALAEQQFDVFVTVDSNLSFQQNLPRFNMAVMILHAPSSLSGFGIVGYKLTAAAHFSPSF